MDRIWSFSPSSEEYLERIIQNAPGAGENSKWLKLFRDPVKPADIHLNYEINLTNEVKANSEVINTLTNQDMEIEETHENDLNCNENIKMLTEFLEREELQNFTEIINKCHSKDNFAKKLIESMTERTAEKLYNLINSAESLKTEFINFFITIFLPQFLNFKRSRLHLDFLMMGYKKFSLEFKSLFLPVVFKNQTQLSFFNDFSQSLNEAEKTDLLNSITNINLTSDEFANNINTILTLYTNTGAVKTDIIQKYVWKVLVDNSERCSADKHFGRLLYSYLSSLKKKPTDLSVLENIIENHRSPMKRACMSVWRKLM